MLTEVKVYSSWYSAPTLLLDANGSPDTDLLQVRDIKGLDPVKASVNTSPYGSVDGASYAGSSVLSRNIVLTLRPNPDWDVWTYAQLRRLVYQYFMPKLVVRLVFYSDDMDPVEIYGIVEGCDDNQFSKDPEFVISIICPDPYFKAVTPTVITGQAILEGGTPVIVQNDGNIESGIQVKVTWTSGAEPTFIGVRTSNADSSYLVADASVSAAKYFEMSSIPTRKYVQNVNLADGVIDNLLSGVTIEEGLLWPYMQPGENEFSVITDQGVQDWELTFYERFGGI